MDDSIHTVTIIANPIAGRGRARRVAAQAERVLTAAGRAAQVHWTTGPGDARALTEERASQSDLVAAIGGDGTVSEVAAGLRLASGRKPPLAVLPAGAGNDLAAALGVPTDTDRALDGLLRGSPRAVDCGVLQVCGDGGASGDVPFLSVVGCGFDARVARRLSGRRLLSGTARYLHGVLQELLVLRAMPARLAVDDQTLEGDFLLIAVANGPAYGGGMRIAPQASLTDGLLDVIAIDRVGRARFLRHFPRVYSGRHLDLPEVHVLRGSRVRIETDQPAPVLLDGDVRAETPIELHVEPSSVRFWLPPPTARPPTG